MIKRRGKNKVNPFAIPFLNQGERAYKNTRHRNAENNLPLSCTMKRSVRIAHRMIAFITVSAVLALICMVDAKADEIQKLPIPSGANQSKIRKSLEETFEISKANTPVKKQQVVKKLVDLATERGTHPDETYICLQMALPLIKEVGDFPSLLTAIERLTITFDVDAEAETSKHLIEFMAACKSSSVFEQVAGEIVSLAQDGAEENRFSYANRLLAAVDAEAKRLKSTKTQKTLTDVLAVVQEREQFFVARTAGLKTLAINPHDPKANFELGRWLAVFEEEWAQALTKLRNGSNGKWKLAAENELKSPTEIDAQVAVADAWWDIAQSASGMERMACHTHALELYERIATDQLRPLEKARVTKRQQEIESAIQHFNSARYVLRITKNQSELPNRSWINLLKMVKLPDHVIKGKWQSQGGSIYCDSSEEAQIMAPVCIQGNYEIRCEFTRISGDETIFFLLPLGSDGCDLQLSSWKGTISGLDMIDGRPLWKEPLPTGIGVRPGKLPNGQRHQLHVDVLQDNQEAAVTAILNKQRIVSWSGRPSQVSRWSHRFLPNPSAITIGVNQSRCAIHRLDLRLKQGSKAHRLEDDWKNPLVQLADTPSKEVASECMTWNNRKYYLSDTPMPLRDAQKLAARLQGRLLTISSAEEEAFIFTEVNDREIWMSGWRRTGDNQWRDERNRPLLFTGKWAKNQPELNLNELSLSIRTTTYEATRGWHDDLPWSNNYACIEWGEEYPEKKSD